MNVKNTVVIILGLLFSSLLSISQSTLTPEQKQELVDRHNYYRTKAGAPPVVWSDKIADEAYIWAKKIAKMDKMVHSNTDYGENIYVSTEAPDLSEVVDLWASEQKYYHGEKISYDNYHLFGHYTQIIWAKTTEIGCAEAVSKSGKHYWVCQYNPPGNYIGQKPVK